MKIIILGAGRVGQSVAENLVSERNDITVIDPNGEALRLLEERLDLRGLAGDGTLPSVLRRAGAQDADMLLACATDDGANLVACKVARTLFNVPTTIARLRSQEFIDQPELLGAGGFGVDEVICPEESVTRFIRRLFEYPEALQVLQFAEGRVSLAAVEVTAASALSGRSLAEIRQGCPQAEMRVVAVYRRGHEVPCAASTRLLQGDEVFLLVRTDQLRAALSAIHQTEQPVRRALIAGGGKVAQRLAQSLRDSVQMKMIERDRGRCDELAASLGGAVLVLHGDATDEELLAEENVGQMDLFLAITHDDEDNILSAMLAKRLGARRVMAIINRKAYADLMEGGAIDIAISPAQTVIGELLAHVRRGDVVAVHSLRHGAAEAIEGVARGDARSSRLVGRRIDQIGLPKGAQVGALVRGEGADAQVLMPHHDTVIQSGDHVIFFIPSKRQVRDIERLFEVGVTFL